MKEGVSQKKYWFLLEWKKLNKQDFINMHGERELDQFTPYEINKLYEAIKAEENVKRLNVLREKHRIKS